MTAVPPSTAQPDAPATSSVLPAPPPTGVVLPSGQVAGPDPIARIRGLQGWRGALILLVIVLGIPLVTGSLAANAIATPAAAVELGGRISVPTLHGWQLVDSDAASGTWLRGDSRLYVEAVDFEGSSSDLLVALDGDLASSSANYASGEPSVTPVIGFGAAALTMPFGATFGGSGAPDDGPPIQVEGLLAAAAADGHGMVVVAYSPQDRFASVEDDIRATLAAISAVSEPTP